MLVSGQLWEVRKAVRPWLIEKNQTYLFGCSGGTDSLALAAALFLESKENTVIPVVVDHGLQSDSAKVAANTVSELEKIGFTKVECAKANVQIVDGLEASARRARYEVFNSFIQNYNPKYFFLAHTLNDQAENVILGLVRGSGTRSLSGMAEQNGRFIRPLLNLSRAETEAACIEANLNPWNDPHNLDERFTRVKIRKNVIPNLMENLGDKVVDSLARSAHLMRIDADALDELANNFWQEHKASFQTQNKIQIEVAKLSALNLAIRNRVLRLAIYEVGARSGSISADMLFGVEELISDWHGQGVISLPGNVKVLRDSGTIILSQSN